MTQNVYIGADVSPILSTSDVSEAANVVDGLFAQAQSSDFPSRAEAFARIVARNRPDVIGLQEVALWRVQSPPDGSTTNAEEIAIDFLELLLIAFAEEGLRYEPAAVREGIDLEVSGSTQDIRLTDREIILVRAGIVVNASLTGTFESNLVLPSPFGGDVTIERGWAAVDVALEDTTVRVVTTHIEVPPFAGIQEAQVAEIRSGPADVDGPLVVLGDINVAPGEDISDAYRDLLDPDLLDAWDAAEGTPRDSATCCYESSMLAEAGELSRRIDIVALGGGASAVSAKRVVDDPEDTTLDNRWPSDHAGVIARVEFD